MQVYGIDVSKFQKEIDWKAVKNSGVKFAIIRAGYRGYGSAGTLVTDPYFKSYMQGAAAAGVPVGVYFFSQAKTAAEGREEAAYCYNLIKPYTLDYPVYIDSEYGNIIHTGRADKLTKAQRTEAVKGFCEQMEAFGYYAAIYASTSWLNNQLDMAALKSSDVWVAHYNVAKPTYAGAYGMWQYTSSGSVSGIPGRVDCNYAYKDYPTIIKNAGLNGYKKPQTVQLYTVTINGATAGDANTMKEQAETLGLSCTVTQQ